MKKTTPKSNGFGKATAAAKRIVVPADYTVTAIKEYKGLQLEPAKNAKGVRFLLSYICICIALSRRRQI